MSALWIVKKDGGHGPGGYELPMFGTYLDEAEARAVARSARAVLVMLPVAEDYREGQAAAEPLAELPPP